MLHSIPSLQVQRMHKDADSELNYSACHHEELLCASEDLRFYATRRRHSCQNQIVQCPQLLCLAVTRWCPNQVMNPFIPYSKGFVRVPHQVRKVASPMVSKALATTEIPTCSRARFSWKIWPMNCDWQHISKELTLKMVWELGEGNSR